MLADDLATGATTLSFRDQKGRTVHLHGHCHQKAFDTMGAVEKSLRAIPGVDVKPIESSCCGMSGAFGYAAATIDISMAMGELSLFPAVRQAGPEDLVVAAAQVVAIKSGTELVGKPFTSRASSRWP
ncbi:hypothetical protein JQ570_32435 [Bradyrhizobium liaoningense]|nr:hypothetical protein [Bradyrhizobium liaoningense]